MSGTNNISKKSWTRPTVLDICTLSWVEACKTCLPIPTHYSVFPFPNRLLLEFPQLYRIAKDYDTGKIQG